FDVARECLGDVAIVTVDGDVYRVAVVLVATAWTHPGEGVAGRRVARIHYRLCRHQRARRTAGDVDGVDHRVEGWPPVRAGKARECDAAAVSAPCRFRRAVLLIRRQAVTAFGQALGGTPGTGDQPQMRRRQRGAGEEVVVGDLERVVMCLDRLGIGRLVRTDEGELRTVRTPAEGVDSMLDVGEAHGVAAIHRHDVELAFLGLVVLGDEGQPAAVGRPAWRAESLALPH